MKKALPFFSMKGNLTVTWLTCYYVILPPPDGYTYLIIFMSKSKVKELQSQGCYALHGFENDHAIEIKLVAEGKCFWYETYLLK